MKKERAGVCYEYGMQIQASGCFIHYGKIVLGV